MSVGLITLLSVGVPFFAAMTLLLAAMLALVSVRWAVRVLGILVIVRSVNPALIGDLVGPVSLLGWLVLGVAGSRILLSSISGGAWQSRVVIWLSFFSLVTVVLGFKASDYLGVSLFKIISFFFGAGVLFLGFRYLGRRGISVLRDVLALWLGVLASSIPFIFVPSVGYFLDGEGFQGATNHPQMLAAICAPVIVWSGFQVLLLGRKAGALAWLLLGMSLVEAFLTRGRTALAAAVLGGVAAVLYAYLTRGRWLAEMRMSKVFQRLVIVALAVGAVVVIYPETIGDAFTSFVYKRDVGNTTIADALESSRGLLIAEEVANFLGSPWVGIGFGVSRSAIHPFQPVIEPLTGIAIGAATEKANIAVALLEEIGIFGAIAFLPFIVSLIRQIGRRAPLSLGAAALGAFSVNISEMVFFSMGGLGLYVLLIMGFAAFYPGEENSSPRSPLPVGQS
jgi:hypothetical protein